MTKGQCAGRWELHHQRVSQRTAEKAKARAGGRQAQGGATGTFSVLVLLNLNTVEPVLDPVSLPLAAQCKLGLGFSHYEPAS